MTFDPEFSINPNSWYSSETLREAFGRKGVAALRSAGLVALNNRYLGQVILDATVRLCKIRHQGAKAGKEERVVEGPNKDQTWMGNTHQDRRGQVESPLDRSRAKKASHIVCPEQTASH